MRTASFTPRDAAPLVFLPFLIACGSSTPSIDSAPSSSVVASQATITGRATYREQMALPPDATFEAVLQDVSRVDAPATAIGRRRIENPGQVPISFSIPYDSTLIDPRRNYVVRASIKV
jgi:putative lipoprotein